MRPALAKLRRPRTWPSLVVLTLTLTLLAGAAARAVAGAADVPEAARAEGRDWTFQVIPFVWVPELQGSVATRGRTAKIDVDFGDIFDLLGDGELFASGGHFEAQYRRRLSLFVDAFGGTARPTSDVTFGPRRNLTGTGDVTMNFAYVEFGPAYRVLDWPQDDGGRPITIDVLVGGRFMYFYESLALKGSAGFVDRAASATSSWVDPFVGGRFSVPLADKLDVMFRGDIGGFGAGSQLAWNVIGGFRYELPWHPGVATTSLYALYKVLDFDYESDGGSQATQVALDQRGPAIGLGFEF